MISKTNCKFANLRQIPNNNKDQVNRGRYYLHCSNVEASCSKWDGIAS